MSNNSKINSIHNVLKFGNENSQNDNLKFIIQRRITKSITLVL